jgi:hypothetical protein
LILEGSACVLWVIWLRLETIVKPALSAKNALEALQVQADQGFAVTFKGMHMATLALKTWTRKSLLLCSLALGLSQVGCAHPVAVSPSVVFSSQIGHAPVYAQVGIHGPMVVMPQPRVFYAPTPPPRVVYVPQVYRPAPSWGRDHGRRHEGRDRRDDRDHDGGRGRGHGHVQR